MSVSAPIKNIDFVENILSDSANRTDFQSLRAHGSKGLLTTPFPTLRDEYWKYTRVSGLLKKEFKSSQIANASISKETLQLTENQTRLVFVNGFLNSNLSVFPTEKGISAHAISTDSDLESKVNSFPTNWENEQEAFTLLNEASFTDGIRIEIAKNQKIESPIFLVHITVGENVAVAQRNFIKLNQGSEATFISVFEGDNNLSFSNHFNSILVDENAKLHWFENHQDGEKANVIGTSIAHQKSNSEISIGAYVFGGKMIRKNFYISVLGQNCETMANGSYILKDQQIADFRVIVDHKAAHCNSNQTFKGVMSDKATGVFNGKIYVRKDSQLINAFQTNRNILLSDDANAYSRPQLEIYADDVKCSHGSTIGQLDEDALFYMMARGIRRTEAEKMLVSAFVADAMDNVNYPAFKELVLENVANKSANF